MPRSVSLCQLASISFLLLALVSQGGRLHADELIQNGGFEQPMVDRLSQDFNPKQQQIPGWTFTGGSVSIVNHTRLMAGTGFQSLLLPCDSTHLTAIQQTFTVPQAGPVAITLQLAASKAVDGDVQILVDGNVARMIEISKFWQPDEIALTDHMKWQNVALPEMNLAAGPHNLQIKVSRFKSRDDRQGDRRSSIQGVLVDAVSIRFGTDTAETTELPSRPWPAEEKPKFDSHQLPTLDFLAGPWVPTRTLACYPAIANFRGAVRATKELGSIQYLYLPPGGSPRGVLNSLQLDGQAVFCDDSRWYPYQLLGRAQAGPLDLEVATRMVFAQHGVLTRIQITNQSGAPVKRQLTMDLNAGKVLNQPDATNILALDNRNSRAYHFTAPPARIVVINGDSVAQWDLDLSPHESREISYSMAMDSSNALSQQEALQWGKDFSASFAAAQSDWEKRWQEAFTPGNPDYSGCLPTLKTDDEALSGLYYLSAVSVLECERDEVFGLKKCFVTASPEWSNSQLWFWDESLMAETYASLDPAAMKTELRLWLTLDETKCNHINLPGKTTGGRWYAVNPYAYFLMLDAYLTTTKDFGFLTEIINSKTVLEHLNDLATEWKKRVPPGGKMADYGSSSWSLLEAPPDYKHTVASFNAANVWMMRRVAEYDERTGDLVLANSMRQDAAQLLPSVLSLYDPHTGSWSVLYPGDLRIDSRHCYDFLTVGTSIADDLSPNIKAGMIAFLDRELMTEDWMRAMSRQDPSALDSDRSDHGPAGSYSGWPAVTTEAVADMGRFDKALDMFHRFRRAFTAAIPQAVELTKVAGKEDLQPRVSERAGASFAIVSGSYAEVIINTFFGFRPSPDGKIALWCPETPRGFDGVLSHVRWGGNLYTITSEQNGVKLTNENTPSEASTERQ